MTMPASTLGLYIRSNALQKEGNDTNTTNKTYAFELHNKKYHITVNDKNEAVSASLISRPDSLWGKIKSAVCDFFRISTNKRLVGSFNMLASAQKEQAKAGIKEAPKTTYSINTTSHLAPLSGKVLIKADVKFKSNLPTSENNGDILEKIKKIKNTIPFHAGSNGFELETKGHTLTILKLHPISSTDENIRKDITNITNVIRDAVLEVNESDRLI